MKIEGDVFTALATLTDITARYADDDNGLVVWSPDNHHITTDVLVPADSILQMGSVLEAVPAANSVAGTAQAREASSAPVAQPATEAPKRKRWFDRG